MNESDKYNCLITFVVHLMEKKDSPGEFFVAIDSNVEKDVKIASKNMARVAKEFEAYINNSAVKSVEQSNVDS